MRISLLLAAVFLISRGSFASPAPAPLLQAPVSGGLNVDPDGALTWRWVDELILNGSFETGMSPGWYTGGTAPGIWTIVTLTTNAYGMGFRYAETALPLSTNLLSSELTQDIYVPADAVSATLKWSERIFNNVGPVILSARLRVLLYQGGTPISLLEDVTGAEPQFSAHTFVNRSTNLLAYAGQSLQLVFLVNRYSPQVTFFNWWADIDGVSFSCEHFSTPEFQVFLGTNSVLRATNQIADTSELSFSMPPLATNKTYFWKVGAVRDAVTNFSATFQFKTGPRFLPSLVYKGLSATGIRLGFSTKTNRNYTIEQSDALDPNPGWYDLLPVGAGTGGPIEVEVPLPWTDQAYWRVRVSP